MQKCINSQATCFLSTLNFEAKETVYICSFLPQMKPSFQCEKRNTTLHQFWGLGQEQGNRHDTKDSKLKITASE